MKKLLTILALSLLLTSAAFAANDVKINGTVASTAYSLKLYYNVPNTGDTLISDNNFVVSGASGRFDLTADGETNDFTVKLSGNTNSIPTVTVTSDATDFLPVDAATKDYKATDKVSVLTPDTEVTFTEAGLYTDYTAHTFKCTWTGNTDLTAGDYQSTVTVTYTVQ